MSIVRNHKPPDVGSPRGRSDLRAAAGLMPNRLVSRAGGGVDASAEEIRVARIDGAVVGACRIAPEVMRLGESRLKLGEIRDVNVHPEFDSLAVRNALLDDALDYLGKHRYHVALATGSEFELRRFGFAAIFRPTAVRLSSGSDGAVQWEELRLRRAKHGDIPAMSRLYAATFEQVPGSVVRSRAHISRIWSEYEDSCVITDNAGKVVAYFVPRVSESSLHVVEFAYGKPVRPRDLKGMLREFADVAECIDVVFHGPDGLLKDLDPQKRHRVRMDWPVGYVAGVDLDELFQSMIPDWESRLSSGAETDDVEVTVMVAGRPYRIRNHRGSVILDNEFGSNKVALTPVEVAEALLGIHPPEEVLKRELRLIRSPAADFFRTLFPTRNPGISSLDLT